MTAMAERRRAAYRLGRRAEAFCALVLRLKGYRILARRFRTPVGELDIVAARGNTFVFVEVKARPSAEAAAEALGPHQRARLERAAAAWLGMRGTRFAPQSPASVRFDVMLVAPWRWPRHIVDAWRVEPAASKGVGW